MAKSKTSPEVPAREPTPGAPAPRVPDPPPRPASAPHGIPGVLELSRIRPSPENDRKHFDEAGLQELADNIGENGVIEPLVVRPVPLPGQQPALKDRVWAGVDYFELVDGERRYRAAKLAGLKDVPTVVRFLSDQEAADIRLATFEHKVDLLPSERASAYKKQADGGRTAEEIAAAVSKPVKFVRQVLKLAKLPAWVLQYVDDGTLPRATAELVASVPGEKSRERCAAQVFVGQYDDPPEKKVGEWVKKALDRELKEVGSIEVMTQRDTQDLIARHYRVELKTATFSRKALDLVEGAGSCDECPKMAGNDPEAKAEGVRADVCLDPVCFKEKTAAGNKLAIAAAKESGKTVLAAKEADKLFNSWDTNLKYNSGYVDLAAKCYEGKANGKTYRTLLKNVEPEKVVVAIDKEGTPHELVKADVAKKVLKDEHKIGAKATGSASDDAWEKRAAADRKKQDAKAKAARAAQSQALARVVEMMRGGFAPLVAQAFAGAVALLRQVAVSVSDFAGADACRVIVKRRGLVKAKGDDDRGAVAKLATDMSDPRELMALIAECAAARRSWGWASPYGNGSMGKEEAAFWKAFGVDKSALVKEAQDEQKKPKKAFKPDYAKIEEDAKRANGKPAKNGKAAATTEAVVTKPKIVVTRGKPLDTIPGFPTVIANGAYFVGVTTDIDLSKRVEKEAGSHDQKIRKALVAIMPHAEPEDLGAATEAFLNYLYPGRAKREKATHPPVTKSVGDLPLIRVDGFPASVAHALEKLGRPVKTLADLGERVEGYEITKPAGETGDGMAHAVYETITRLVGFDNFLGTTACDAVMRHLQPGWKLAAKTTTPACSPVGKCRVCGCVEENCRKCIERTGVPCSWTSEKQDLCSACLPLLETDVGILFMGKDALPDNGTVTKLDAAGVRTVGHVLALDPKSPPRGLFADAVKALKKRADGWLKQELKPNSEPKPKKAKVKS